jgi:DNA-binding NarL/FixJ family response regulator
MNEPRVLIVDDQELVRTGFAMILKAAGIPVVGQAADGREAIRLARELRPDVVLMDIRMPEIDGLEATRQILADGAGQTEPPRIIILTTFDIDRYVYDALVAGASGFLLKDVSASHLANAVRLVMTGDALLSPVITRRLVEQQTGALIRGAQSVRTLGTLTPRELDVLRIVATGQTNAEIAALLHLSETTVKTHVSNVLTKLGVKYRVQAVVIAYESGLVAAGGGNVAAQGSSSDA